MLRRSAKRGQPTSAKHNIRFKQHALTCNRGSLRTRVQDEFALDIDFEHEAVIHEFATNIATRTVYKGR
jgi:hypothetical protein